MASSSRSLIAVDEFGLRSVLAECSKSVYRPFLIATTYGTPSAKLQRLFGAAPIWALFSFIKFCSSPLLFVILVLYWFLVSSALSLQSHNFVKFWNFLLSRSLHVQYSFPGCTAKPIILVIPLDHPLLTSFRVLVTSYWYWTHLITTLLYWLCCNESVPDEMAV